MSSSKFLKNGIPLNLAKEVKVNGQVVAHRLVNAIEPEHRDQAAEEIASAVEGSKLFSADQKKKIALIGITSVSRYNLLFATPFSTPALSSMPHKSKLDPKGSLLSCGEEHRWKDHQRSCYYCLK